MKFPDLRSRFRPRAGILLAAAAFTVPLHEGDPWTNLKYRNIPANHVTFSSDGLRIDVRNSAGPLVFKLPKTLNVIGLRWTGKIHDFPNLPSGIRQGEKGADDYAIRIGLVLEGKKRPSFAEKLFAPQWVKTLFSLAPEGSGIDRILFLSVGQQEAMLGRERIHPLSDFLEEKVEWVRAEPGKIDVSASFEDPLPTLAVWISSDGDDTKSKFTVQITSLTLNTVTN